MYVSYNAIPPCIAVFMEGKPVQTCPDIVSEVQIDWINLVRTAEVIGIIGVRPNDADVHVWKPLAEASARIVVIGNKDEYERWDQRSGRTGPLDVVGSRFTPSMSAFTKSFLR